MIATRVNGVLSYNLADHLGSTVQQIDSMNTPGPAIKYFPFGAPRNGTTSPERAFTGQQREDDSPLGMYYYHARFYSSVLGHFMSADTSTKDGLDRYTYVGNNPLGYVDPSGRDAEDCFIICGSSNEPITNFEASDGDVKYAQQVASRPNETGPLVCLDCIALVALAEASAMHPGINWADAIHGASRPDMIAMNLNAQIGVHDGAVPCHKCDDYLANGVATAATLGVAAIGRSVATAGIETTFDAISPGPLADPIADTFAGGRYTVRIPNRDTVFYRAYGGAADVFGSAGTFVSPDPIAGGLQTQIDQALRPEWGNTAIDIAAITVAKGTTVYEGIASSQGDVWVGGSVQVFIP